MKSKMIHSCIDYDYSINTYNGSNDETQAPQNPCQIMIVLLE